MRELIVYSYRVIYRLEQGEVLIVAVIHGKRVLQ
jgi:plasmid stabilization system protein ParE